MKRRVCAVVEATRFVGVQLRYAFKVCNLRIRVASIPFDHLTILTLDASFEDLQGLLGLYQYARKR